MNLSALEAALREHAFNDDQEPSLCWDLYVNSLGVRVNAAARASHVDQDDAFADATNLVGHLIETGSSCSSGLCRRVSAMVVRRGGGVWWRSCSALSTDLPEPHAHAAIRARLEVTKGRGWPLQATAGVPDGLPGSGLPLTPRLPAEPPPLHNGDEHAADKAGDEGVRQ
jgi:hypothetical protein